VYYTVLSDRNVQSSLCYTGYGIEFSLSSGYAPWGTTPDYTLTNSGTANALGGILATMKANLNWSWADIKAALRQTASCWAGGWQLSCGSGGSSQYGFGDVNYTAAIALTNSGQCSNGSTPTVICLQPPGVAAINRSSEIAFTIYPFTQSRRNHEILVVGGSGYSNLGCGGAGQCNELTLTQITNGGGTIVEIPIGAAGQPENFVYGATFSGSQNYEILTSDTATSGGTEQSTAHFSRMESYVVKSYATVPPGSCFK
jgi:hypothetical protein